MRGAGGPGTHTSPPAVLQYTTPVSVLRCHADAKSGAGSRLPSTPPPERLAGTSKETIPKYYQARRDATRTRPCNSRSCPAVLSAGEHRALGRRRPPARSHCTRREARRGALHRPISWIVLVSANRFRTPLFFFLKQRFRTHCAMCQRNLWPIFWDSSSPSSSLVGETGTERGDGGMLRVSEDGGRRRAAHAAGYGDLGRALLDLQAAADQVFDTISKRVCATMRSPSLVARTQTPLPRSVR